MKPQIVKPTVFRSISGPELPGMLFGHVVIVGGETYYYEDNITGKKKVNINTDQLRLLAERFRIDDDTSL